MSDTTKGTILAMLSGMLYGAIGYFGIKILSAHSVPTLLFWRFFFATLVVSPFCLYISWRTLFKDWKLLCAVLVLGVGFFSASGATYFLASRLIGTGLSMVIFFSYPALVIMLAWLLDKERPSFITFISIMFIIGGCLCIASKQFTTLDITGIIWAALSALLYALYVFGSKKTASVDPKLATFLVCFGNMLVFLVVGWWSNELKMPQMEHWGNIIALALLATALPMLLFLKSLQYIPPSIASIVAVLQPIVTLIMGVVLLNEPITIIEILGSSFILLGTIIVQLKIPKYSALKFRNKV